MLCTALVNHSPRPILAPLTTIEAELRRLLDDESVLPGDTAAYLSDETETRGVHGQADAVCRPADAEAVAAVVEWCYDRDVPIVPRGGGTGYAGGSVPIGGGVVVSLERVDRVLPSGVQLHLYGVKSTALDVLLAEAALDGRVRSVDSMAWDVAAR